MSLLSCAEGWAPGAPISVAVRRATRRPSVTLRSVRRISRYASRRSTGHGRGTCEKRERGEEKESEEEKNR